jgi:predicted alpha/beta hydrolase family esterase
VLASGTSMTVDTLLIVKGFGYPDLDRWQDHEEKIARASSAVKRVLYPRDVPDFQGDATPLVTDFIAFFRELLSRESVEPDRVLVLAHSLGGDGWMHLVHQMKEYKDAMTRLVAVPSVNNTGYENIRDFFDIPHLQLSIAQRMRWLVIGSDRDPVIHETPDVLAGRLGVQYVSIDGAAHFMPRTLHGDLHQMDLGKEWGQVRNRIALPYFE